MKAEELMIGDWIGWLPTWKNEETGKIEGDGDRNDPIIGKVGMLMKDCTTIDYCDESIEVEDIELIPIPLTPEILEKNGFKKCNVDTDRAIQYEFGSENLGVDIWTPGSMTESHLLGAWKKWPNCTKSYSMIIEMPIHYVHELQHALRLCGIEKEIEL